MVLLLGGLAWREYIALDPLLPPRLFANSVLMCGISIAAMCSAAMLGATFLLPLFFQLVRGVDASASGAMMVPLLVVVRDNGQGIPAEEIDHVFSLFVSKKGNRGTGLGLPVSQKIIKEHGGRIVVASQLGTRFCSGTVTRPSGASARWGVGSLARLSSCTAAPCATRQ